MATQESDWRQSTVSDESNTPTDCVGGATPPCPTSFGIMQLKHTYLPGSYPLSQQSTAFNVDYYGARIRACYEGWGHLSPQRLPPRRHLALRGLALVRPLERRRRQALRRPRPPLPRQQTLAELAQPEPLRQSTTAAAPNDRLGPHSRPLNVNENPSTDRSFLPAGTCSFAAGDSNLHDAPTTPHLAPTDGGCVGLLVTMFLILPRLRQMIYTYPTFHRAIEDALGDLSE